MTSNIQILSDLRLAMDMKQTLELMVIYKGLPVISKAQIQAIEKDTVLMTSPDPGLVCLRAGQQTSILGSDYFEPSTARVVKVDLSVGQVKLHEFSYLGNRLGERMIIRVEPKAPIPIRLKIEEMEIQGAMVDISISGAGFQIPLAHYSPLLKPGANLIANFELPDGMIVIPAAVLSGSKIGDRYRMSVRFGPNGDNKVLIFHYLVDRRNEIEQELIAEYERTREKDTN